MIAQLHGTLAHKSPEQLIVDVNGVGYLVLVSLNSFYRLPDPGGSVRLLIHTHVREDALQLFGFLDQVEKEMFLQLVSVSGIGPRLALNILSGTPLEQLLEALEAGDLVRLVAIPGIGKKTAERLVLELRDKVKQARAARGDAAVSAAGGDFEEAISALVNLGYRRNEAERAVKSAKAEGAKEIETLIRGALKRLSG
jgi:Holliday junction DNA helicase RuvA